MQSISLRRCAVAAASAGLSAAACAVEGAATHAALGFNDSLHGAAFPDGLYVRLDVLEYRATRLKDRHGNDATARLGPGLGGPARLKATGAYEQLTLFKQTSIRIPFLNNDTLGFGATFLYGTQRVELDTFVPALAAYGLPPRQDLGSARTSTLGDTTLFPLYLGWRLDGTPWSITANPLNVYLKTGGYDPARPQNLGRNYNAWAPQVAASYVDTTLGREFSVQLNYLRNGRNSATNYRSGDEAFLAFGLHQWVSAELKVGLSGYHYRQLSDDRRGGIPVFSTRDTQPDVFGNGVGNRGRVSGIGPSLEWRSPFGVLNVHWLREFGARNLPQADRLWLKYAVRF